MEKSFEQNNMESLIIKKIKPIFLRYQEINKLLEAPEVMADIKWYQRLIFEHKNIEEIAKGYEELNINLNLINEFDKKNEESEEILYLKNLNKDLIIDLLTKISFSGQNDDNGAIIILKGAINSKNCLLDLEKMYVNLAKENKWTAKSKLKINTKIVENKIEIIGINAFAYLKNEIGIFEITNKNGEKFDIEVLILPLKEKMDIIIDNKDIKIEVSHASGAGGQNVNKVATAIRAVHIPTNTAVNCQDERSQYANKEKALKRLKEKVNKIYEEKIESNYENQKKICIGKLKSKGTIRKFDYKNKIVTDLKSGLTFLLDDIFSGKLDEIIKIALL